MKLRFRPVAHLGFGVFTVTVLLLGGGCGSDEVKRVAVKGTVTLDGAPLEQGRILFEPAAGNTGPSAGASIQGGVFEVPAAGGVVAGKNRVRINANKPTGKKIKSSFSDQMLDETEEAIPAKYNAQSTLEADVGAGENELDFDLKSK